MGAKSEMDPQLRCPTAVLAEVETDAATCAKTELWNGVRGVRGVPRFRWHFLSIFKNPGLRIQTDKKEARASCYAVEAIVRLVLLEGFHSCSL